MDDKGWGVIFFGCLFALLLWGWNKVKAKKALELVAEQARFVKAAAAHKVQMEKALPHVKALQDLLVQKFDCSPCSRCAELEMVVRQMSPNGRSFEVVCAHCLGVFRWKAVHPDTSDVVSAYRLAKDAIAGCPCVISVSVPPDKFSREGGRERIPKGVRQVVWRRDGGRCVQCGAEVNLHFDHIIPVAKGGATTVENLQILCAPCNMSKGAKI